VGAPLEKNPTGRGWGVQLLHDGRDNLWVATRNAGLWRVQNASSARGRIVDVITTAQGLATDAVQCVFEDREGNVWLGTQAGLQRLTPNKVTPIATLPLARAAAMTPDGSVWIGSAKGLTRFSGETRRDYTEHDGMGGTVVLALHADLKGTLWVATENGVSQLVNERFSRVIVPSDSVVQRVFSIATTSSGTWLRGMSRSLFKVTTDGRLVVPPDVPEDIRRTTLTLASDSHDNLWIGGMGGKAGLLHPDGRFETHVFDIGAVNAIYETSDGQIWIGGESGIGRLANGREQTLKVERGLPPHIKSIVEDTDGVLWVGFLTGIARIERQEIDRALSDPHHQLDYRLFNTADGAAGVPMSDGSPTAVRSSDGRLWFATSAGVTVVDPHRLANRRAPLPAMVEEFSADRWQGEPRDGATLPAHATNIQFVFTTSTLADSQRVQFRYQLEGIDQDWIEAGTARKALYASLGPGDYHFRVMASNGEGVWSEPIVLSFGVSPAFYQTRWFYALCGLAALTLLWMVWHLNARRVRHQFALVLAERIRMSRAIHDTLLQGFAGLALQLDDLSHGPEVEYAATGERLRRIRRRVEDYIREARQSIWDLRSPVLERRAFPEALREVGTRAIADREVSLDINIKGVPQPCSPVIEQQLLLICQEALTNAVRHGAPRRVDVELEYGGEELRVIVRDDGRGFDLHTVEGLTGHYGVVSMRERAAQVRGRLTIDSAPGKGTSVETIIPVH
jgi:ligand-binding sensor domain-containing protein/two-component sensor histidine kinase